jgi:4,5-DOPA dioxygenase extradiol
MAAALPTLFLSHGSPMHALQAGRAGAAWAELGRRLPRPRAVLVASAHWETEEPMVSLAAQPETIHDFGGFAPELHRLQYPAPGAPEVGERTLALLRAAGFAATAAPGRGLDHGAWVPLLHMYPAAAVPVLQISVQSGLDAAHHLRLGRALAPLADEGVLVLGSGHVTHNLREWMQHVRQRGMQPGDGPAAPYVEDFRRWVEERLAAHDEPALTGWLQQAPHARRAHPSDEHFLPLFVAYGAAGLRPQVERIDAGVDAAVLAMDAYLFSPRSAPG